VADSNRRERLRFGVGRIGFLRRGHPLATLFSSVDVHRDDRARCSAQPLGIFPRNLCGRLLGLRKCFCDHFLFQGARRAFSLGPHRTSGSSRPSYRGAGVVLQSIGRNRVYVGVFTEAHKTSQRYRQVFDFLGTLHGLFRRGHGLVPASLSPHLSSIARPAPALSGVRRPTTRRLNRTVPAVISAIVKNGEKRCRSPRAAAHSAPERERAT
jgi:hypothetical protein